MCEDGVVIRGLDIDISEPEILEILRTTTYRKILDLFLVRGATVDDPPCGACEAALVQEIGPFMPSHSLLSSYCHVKVVPPEPMDCFMRALITFDGRLHLEAAKALHHIVGKVLAGCLPWQKIQCQQMFHCSLSCPAPVYAVIKTQLDSIFTHFKCRSDLSGIKEKVPEAELSLDAKHHVICVRGNKGRGGNLQICPLNVNGPVEHPGGVASPCSICLCENLLFKVVIPYKLHSRGLWEAHLSDGFENRRQPVGHLHVGLTTQKHVRHLECHPCVSCERYKEFKKDPDLSLKEWCQGKENVKRCPVCSYTIEKVGWLQLHLSADVGSTFSGCVWNASAAGMNAMRT
ncbi:helicase domain-containing protein [Actinidia rufa]|uniref:Helicase domain-containing protein n=1 Tax=Actinidia rufa TaxID=165716 RepID=A0A7J0DH19_9ERIC|nr:helicase domain-containing protein [Actinidia rufa]